MNRALIDSLPPAAASGDWERVRTLVAASGVTEVVLDDDPTGTQTMHGIDVLADWSVASLARALSDRAPCFYVLTNSRSLPASEAAALYARIAANLKEAAASAGRDFFVVSRSDSTLRGHFAEELGALESGLGQAISGTLVIPAFFEGGRVTAGDVHYVAEGDVLTPAAETEFARDTTFGYRHSNLREWIQEKTKGRVQASTVASFGIETLRAIGGADRVREQLLALPHGAYAVVNAAAYADLEVFVHGLLQAEALGRRFLCRTAASFVRVRAGIDPRPLLEPAELRGPGVAGGLLVVGSYTQKTTRQLQSVLALPNVTEIELDVGQLAEPVARDAEIDRVCDAAIAVMQLGRQAVVYTSRGLSSALGVAGDLRVGRTISEALVAVVRAIPLRPRFLIAKGGITSNDIAVLGIGMQRARVVGQASAGVPVWLMGPETRFPGLPFVVWPGNVGGDNALRDLLERL